MLLSNNPNLSLEEKVEEFVKSLANHGDYGDHYDNLPVEQWFDLRNALGTRAVYRNSGTPNAGLVMNFGIINLIVTINKGTN